MSVVLCRYEVFYQRIIRDCPTCKRKRRMVAAQYVWHGPVITCLACGDTWDDDGRQPRPFKRGWRQEAIAAAKANWTEGGNAAACMRWVHEQIGPIRQGGE